MSDFREKVCSVFFQDCVLKDSKTSSVNDILTICAHHELFGSQKASSIQDVLSHIHSCLSSTKDRSEGLLLLDGVIDQSTTEVFASHAQTWCRLLIQTLQSHSTAAIHVAACCALTKLIAHSKTFAELSREITSTYLPQLLPLLLNVADKVRPVALACINSCIQNYPGTTGPHRNKLEALVTQELDTANPSKEVYRSYALLAQCGGGGNQGGKYTDAWTGQCDKLLGSLASVLNQLYEGFDTGAGRAKARPTLSFSPIRSTEGRVSALVTRLRVLTECLETMISTEFPFAVKLPVESIVQFVSRCVAVNSNMLLSHPTTERILLSLQLPIIHTAALKVLKRLIYTCKSLLVPYSNIVVSLFSQELVWTHTEPVYGQDKPYRQLRSTVYDTLCAWLTALQSSACIDTEQNVLIQEMLHDCSPHVDSIKIDSIMPNKSGDAGTSQKKKKGAYQEITHGISSQRKVNKLANSQSVATALEGLYWMVTTSGSELDRKCLQDIQAFTVKTLLSVQQTPEASGPIPYSDWGCRLGLYKLLVACMLTPHPSAPPPVQCAVGILSIGLQDPHSQVSSYCLEAMRISDCLIHPRVPCLNGPIRCQNVVNIGGATHINGEPVTENGENKNQSAGTVDTQPKPSNVNKYADFQNIGVENIVSLSGVDSVISKSHLQDAETVSKKRTALTSVDGDGQPIAKLARFDTSDGNNGTDSQPISEKVVTDTATRKIVEETFTAELVTGKTEIESLVKAGTSHTSSSEKSVDDGINKTEPQPSTSRDETSGEILIVSDDENVLLDSSDDDDDIQNIDDIDDEVIDSKDEDNENNGETIEIMNEDSNSNDVSIVEPAGKEVNDENTGEIVDKETATTDQGLKTDGGDETGTGTDKTVTDKTEVDAMLSTFVDAGPDSD